MPDLIRSGARFLERQRHEHLSHSVVYRRGSAEVSVPATVGQTEAEEVDGDGGQVLISRSRDYLIRAEDLVLSGVRVMPERGDEILEVVGDRTIRCEVRTPTGGGAPPYRWSDPERITLRVHTKVVAHG